MKGLKHVIITLFFCILLSACNKGNDKGLESSAASQIDDTGTAESVTDSAVEQEELSEEWTPAVIQRQVLLDENYTAGVIYLGYIDAASGDFETDAAYYKTVLEKSGYLNDFPFLKEVPASAFVCSEGGQELYCIIPQDVDASVAVNEWIVDESNDYEGETGAVLYRSDYGSPILIKCNSTEIYSDVQVTVVDNKGNSLTWRPSVSGEDGSVYTASARGALYDFTYNEADTEPSLLAILTGSGYESYWSDEYDITLASVTYPIIKPDQETAENYPKLADALSRNNASRKEKLFASYEERKGLAEEFYPDLQQYFSVFETTENAMIRRADSNALSILYHGYSYEGGIHGYSYYWGENYDPNTGKLLKLQDVVSEMDLLPKAVREQLDLHWEPNMFYADLNLADYFKESIDNIAWTLDYNGITFYFNPFEIAPYASGTQIVTVAFKDYPDLFFESYKNTPESYGVQLDFGAPYYYDADNDGSLDEFLVFGRYTEDMYMAHNIFVDQAEYFETDDYDIYAYELMNLHFVHCSDRNYLYIENLSDNDYRTITVYEVSTGKPEKLETLHASFHTESVDDSYHYLTEALLNPYYFRLDTRTWIIGTRSGYMTYYVSDEGVPYSYEDYYTFDTDWDLPVLHNFKVTILDETEQASGSYEVKAGEIVRYYRTDASVYADFILQDGRIGRVDLEWLEGSCSIDGIRVEELFEGVVFAG